MQNKFIALALLTAVMASPSLAQAEGKDGVAAVVNGEKITVSEVRSAYNANPQLKGRVSFNEFYNKALDGFVSGKIVYQEAVKADVMDTPEYKSQLELAKQELARKVYLEKQVEGKVSDDQVKKLYSEYKSTFKPEKEIKAKHILVQDQAKAKEVIAKLAKGGNFDKLAKEYSKEPAELGYFTKRVMVPEFADAAFAMKKGETSKTAVKTKFGYHVIAVEDVRDSKPLPMKEVEPQLKAMLTQGALAESFQGAAQKSKVEKYTLDGKVIAPEQKPAQ